MSITICLQIESCEECKSAVTIKYNDTQGPYEKNTLLRFNLRHSLKTQQVIQAKIYYIIWQKNLNSTVASKYESFDVVFGWCICR